MLSKKIFSPVLLFAPLLWLRTIILYILGICIFLGLLVYFVANSPWVIKKIADDFAPDYNISYSRIYGNALTGLEIENLTYLQHPLAKHLTLKWNPNGLIRKQIMVNHLALDRLNVDTIKRLVSDFSSEENTSSKPFAFSVKVDKVDVTIGSFVEHNIMVKHIGVHTKDIYYDHHTLDMKNLDFVVDTNITKIALNISLENGIVEVQKAKISALDTLALEQMFHTKNSTSNVDTQVMPQSTSSNLLMPTRINIDSFEVDILPRTLDALQIDAFVLKISKTTFDVNTSVVEKGRLLFSTQTNFANATHEGNIRNNHLLGMLRIKPKKTLATTYNIPLRVEALDTIAINLDATKVRIIAGIDTKIMQVLNAKKDAFNFDIDVLKSTVTYTLDDGKLKADSNAILSTPYTKDIRVSNLFVMDDTISYKGNIFVKQILGVDPKFTKPVDNLHITYHGDKKSIDTDIDSTALKGTFISKDFKSARFHLESKQDILLREYVALPSELNATQAKVIIDAPIDFDVNTSYVATVNVLSDLASIDANVSYKDTLQLKTLIDIPEKSHLRAYNEALKWDKLMPIKAEATFFDTKAEAIVHAGTVHTRASYELNSSKINADVDLGGFRATIEGMVQKKLKIHSTVSSIPSLLNSISEVYTLESLPKVEGSANLNVEIDALKKIDISLISPLVRYHADRKSTTDIENIDVGLHYEEGNLTLQHYNVIYNKEKIFATKPSHLSLSENIVKISPLWVNDQLTSEGKYDLKSKKGKIVSKANKLHIAHEIIDLDSNIDITTVLDGNKTNVEGKIFILSGNIHYDISQKSFASDSDIVIIQEMEKEANSTFMDNLSVELQVKTKKPLLYNKDTIDLKANVDLGIHKAEHSELLVLGDVELLKGSTYIFQEKKFVLEKSMVYFTGNPNKPLLDIKVHYKALKYLVTISITGSADLPNITFTSKPSLTKEQILSLILFDTEGGAGTNSGDEMMKMMGGTMAKSVLNNLGVKIDHLVLGEGNSVEVGKKLTNKMTIIYVNDIVSGVKLKYEHSPRTESVLNANQRSESYDIIYKRDF